MSLTEFLLERIAEDEAAADVVTADMPRWGDPSWEADALEVGGSLPGPQFTARMSPARVLSECAAKRVIVTLHYDLERVVEDPGAPEGLRVTSGGECAACHHQDMPCDTLRALALPYVDHPDYEAAWRP